ncbi:MAG: EscU/YscU/HrcU family type III secretion system export apparatus switch protein [Treponema sp.]|nr:EscU/YscU/HrcU family type III secretion system export apparatus switch protein [Treponema sp.]
MNKAVALKYPENAYAPFITAKGTGLNAERILEIARENDIPVKVEETSVEILSAQDIGQSVSEETWEVLAIIFAQIMEKK